MHVPLYILLPPYQNIIRFRLISYSLNTSINLTLIKHIIQNLERAHTNLLIGAEIRNTNKVVVGRAWHTLRHPAGVIHA